MAIINAKKCSYLICDIISDIDCLSPSVAPVLSALCSVGTGIRFSGLGIPPLLLMLVLLLLLLLLLGLLLEDDKGTLLGDPGFSISETSISNNISYGSDQQT